MRKNAQPNQIDLVKLFGAVANNMGNQRESLNQADTYNNDHGDNMVEIFEVVTQAVKEKKNADPADQLAYASEILRRKKTVLHRYMPMGLPRPRSNSRDSRSQRTMPECCYNHCWEAARRPQPLCNNQVGVAIY